MQQKIVEDYSKRRYNLLLGQTIGFAVWFPAFLYIWIAENPYGVGLVMFPLVIGAIIYFFSLMRLNKLVKEIRSDPKLEAALNDELYIAETNKAVKSGYILTMTAIALMYCVTIVYDIPAKVITGVLLYIGALSVSIAKLILYK